MTSAHAGGAIAVKRKLRLSSVYRSIVTLVFTTGKGSGESALPLDSDDRFRSRTKDAPLSEYGSATNGNAATRTKADHTEASDSAHAKIMTSSPAYAGWRTSRYGPWETMPRRAGSTEKLSPIARTVQMASAAPTRNATSRNRGKVPRGAANRNATPASTSAGKLHTRARGEPRRSSGARRKIAYATVRCSSEIAHRVVVAGAVVAIKPSAAHEATDSASKVSNTRSSVGPSAAGTAVVWVAMGPGSVDPERPVEHPAQEIDQDEHADQINQPPAPSSSLMRYLLFS